MKIFQELLGQGDGLAFRSLNETDIMRRVKSKGSRPASELLDQILLMEIRTI